MGWKAGKFPNDPPERFDPADPYADPVALLEYREWAMRRKNIDVEKAKILRDKVQVCYKVEGVNHYQNCRDIVLRYIDSIKNIGIHAANAGPHDLGRGNEPVPYHHP